MFLRLVQFITEHDENNRISILQFVQMSSNGFAELSNLHSVDRPCFCTHIITNFNVGNVAFLAQVFAPTVRSPDVFLRGLRSGMPVISLFSLVYFLTFW
jgi:hypothetical protein